ncbi:MAG: hypothetical protein IJ636_05300, partial [Bacteroidales bacterium]|nr:hypothetical protein [Bacteroidales bacterium]
MTTHVFIVNEISFKYHLQYLFAGTGAKDNDVDFSGCPTSVLYPASKHFSESGLVGMMADSCRIRKNDLILFYLQSTAHLEGRFYGVFQASGDAFLDRNDGSQFLRTTIGKNLTFRVKIVPYEVYSKGVTEWKALDEIRNITSPCQMLWSLIYRKLKGNRGNTMITIYESERLIELIRKENNYIKLQNASSYDYSNGIICTSKHNNTYAGRQIPFDILPRLINKYDNNRAFESHLQMHIVQSLGRNTNLDGALTVSPEEIEWIGNEVSCGVGMQRIDVMVSLVKRPSQRIIMPIELKSVQASVDNLRQISRYIDWIEQYYIPNRISTILPVLICLHGGLTDQLRLEFKSFNSASGGRYLPLRYIEFS